MHPSFTFGLRSQARTDKLGRISVFAAMLICSVPAFAQGATDGEPSSTWALGVGVISKQQPYTDIDRDNQVFPLLQYENKYVQIFGPQIGFKLPGLDIGESQRLNFSIVGKYDGSGYEAKDARILRGMDERKGGIWVGAEVEWKNELADVKAAWLTDASSHSKGQKFSLGVEKTWHFGEHMMLTPRVEASWHDKKYIDYYYGVTDSEARADRLAYTGKAGTSAEVGVRGIYMFDQTHSLFMDVSVSSLPKEIKDSPLVDSSTENRILLGYIYRFR